MAKKRVSKKQLQAQFQDWYETACWYGYVNTTYGRFTDCTLKFKARELGLQELRYVPCS